MDMETYELIRSRRKTLAVEITRDGRVLVRASGTEPLIRVMVEAKTTEIAQNCADRLVDLVNLLKNER